MGFGSIILFIVSLIVEGLPNLSLISIIYIIWLASRKYCFSFQFMELNAEKFNSGRIKHN